MRVRDLISPPAQTAVDVVHDPGERTNLCGQTVHRAVREELQDRLHAFFTRYADPKWDLWRGGDAKGGLLMGKEPYAKA